MRLSYETLFIISTCLAIFVGIMYYKLLYDYNKLVIKFAKRGRGE